MLTTRPLLCLVLLLLCVSPPGGYAEESVPDVAALRQQVEVDARPRLAVAGFTGEMDDRRDAWVPVAVQELLARRLLRTGRVVTLPSIRLHQAREELRGPGGEALPWSRIAGSLGATHLLTGRCTGLVNEVAVELSLQTLAAEGDTAQTIPVPADRLEPVLHSATREVLKALDVEVEPAALRRLAESEASRAPSAIEYYAQTVVHARAGEPREALRYAQQAADADARFRPALAVLAQLESQAGPARFSAAARRLRVLNDLGRLKGDPFDRVRAEIGQALILQGTGAFEAARTRAQTALELATAERDVYGQLAAMSALAEVYLTRPVAVRASSDGEHEALARESLMQAGAWQRAIVEMLDALGDRLAELPAAQKLALIRSRLEQHEHAGAAYQRALERAQELGSKPHQTSVLLLLAQWHSQREQWDEALEAARQALELAGDDRKPAIRMVVGGIHEALGSSALALRQYEQAYGALRDTDQLMTQLDCLRQIAVLKWRLGQKQEAIKTLQQAIDIAHALDLRIEQPLREQLDTWKSAS